MNNKTFRLFISSTFSDFLEERRILNKNIYDRISRLCQSRGYHFQLIDLRWGVNSESALMQNTLAICLEEVRRCTRLAPRPNFLLMAGERYGWIPLPSQISREDFEAVLSVSAPDARALLTEWYRLDENEIGGAFFLKFRSGEYAGEQLWGQIEDKLRDILIEGGIKRRFSPEKMTELTSSATEREILEGMLDNPELCDNVIAVFRTGYPQKDPDLSRIEAMRGRIRQRMQQDHLADNIVELTYDESYAAQFEARVCALLEENVEQEIRRLEALAEDDDEDIVLRSILEKCSGTYFPRADLIRELDDYVNGPSDVPLFLVGESGSGKSTLLAAYIDQAPLQSYYVFPGYGVYSNSLSGALGHIQDQLRLKYNIPGNRGRRGMASGLSDIFSMLPKDETILVVIDGLDTFYDLPDIHENVFPSRLPGNVKLIVSSADRDIAEQFRSHSSRVMEIGLLDRETSLNTLTAMLAARGRCIANPKQIACVRQALSGGATPLQLTLLSALCAQWRSHEKDVQLPGGADSLALRYIRNLFSRYGHDEELVLHALALIAVSPAGITEHMLQQMLLGFPSVQEHFLREDRYSHDLRELPFVIWSRLFYDFQDGLEYAFSGGNMVVRARHNVFVKAMTRHYPGYCAAASDALIAYYWSQSHCTENGHPNYLKLQTLPLLLKENGKAEQLRLLLSDLAYVDSAVRAGYLDTVMEYLSAAIRMCADSGSGGLPGVLRCLQRNRERLSCYRKDFPDCAYDDGLTTGRPPILSLKKTQSEDQALYFPHSAQSRVAWFPGGSAYAVWEESEISVYDAGLYLLRARIQLSNDVLEKDAAIREVVWLQSRMIAAATSAGEILVYVLGENGPRLHDRLAYDAASGCIGCVMERDLLLYCCGGKLCARDIPTGQTRYQISMPKKFGFGFDIDAEANELTVWKQTDCIGVYDLDTGEEKYTQKLRLSKKWMLRLAARLDERFYIKKLGPERWLLSRPASNWYAVAEDGRVRYLLPPTVPGSDKKAADLSGKKSHIVLWEHLLLLIDLENGYTLRYYPLRNVSSAAWLQMDQQLSVIADQGLAVIRVDDFRQIGEGQFSCFSSQKDLRDSLLFAPEALDQSSKSTKLGFDTLSLLLRSKEDDLFQYRFLFGAAALEHDTLTDNKATLAVYARDGKKAVAYEGRDTIMVFDPEGNVQLVLDKLKLAINGNILGMDFSPDGSHLLLWRNHWLDILHTATGASALRIELALRPALRVRFREDGALCVLLCDGTEYTYAYEPQSGSFECAQPLPEKLVSSVDLDTYFGPYAAYPEKGRWKSVSFIGTDYLEKYDIRDLRDTRAYHGKKHWLLYRDGEFFLDGDTEKVFSHPYTDFRKSLSQERQQSASPLFAYLREKNDLFSVLYEPGENGLVLISRALNSVIAFDLKQMCVTATYKVTGNIIGIRETGPASIALIRDSDPINIRISLRAPDAE